MKERISAINNKYSKIHKLRVMKNNLIFFSIFFLSITVNAFSQKITLELGEVSLDYALKSITAKSDVNFFYSNDELDVNKTVNASFVDTELTVIVESLVGVNYKVQKESDSIILIIPVKEQINAQQQLVVKGKVVGENNVPLLGVTVMVKDEYRGTTTDFDGNYIITVKGDAVLIFSSIGYQTQEISVDNRELINVTLLEEVSGLDEVILTGIVERKKESYTGAVNTITGAELKQIGNQNIIQSIKSLDPSFIMLDNNLSGSNPNVLPNLEVRGKSSVTSTALRDEYGADPNQPLFVLDGFETDLRTIIDLDMNRVASITILKDAASTSMYGAKAANGVVVVETLRPEAGELRLSYTGDFSVEIPDLTDYNLMNAEEKLEFERLSGRWQYYTPHPVSQYQLDSIYNSKLAEVRRGVNTYWLDKPLQTGFTQRHSINVDGGSEDLLFRAGLSLRDQKGAMIGSGRQTWGANLDLAYRKNKWNISNRLYVSGSDADESKYGSFSNFAQANPYYKPTNEFGEIEKYLDRVNVSGVTSYNLSNPLYIGELGNINNTNAFNIQNSLEAIYSISSKLRVSGGLQLKKGTSTQEIFFSPNDPRFDGSDTFEKGSYRNVRFDNSSYMGNIMLTYFNVFADRHSLNANLRADIEETKQESYSTVAVGFPIGVLGNPNFSFGYQPDSKPNYNTNLYRRNNVLASVNYTFDDTYLFDATFRMDGSTAFGSNKQYSPFWAVGLGWNLHNEFDINKDVVDVLKIRGNIGSTGNQSFGSIATTSVYGFSSKMNSFGQGIELLQLANENLRWQNTLQSNIGLDLQMFNRRLSASFEYFNKKTDPLVVLIDLPSSTGIRAYPYNVGHLNVKGFESIIKYSPIYRIQEEIVWTLGATVSSYTSKYGGLDNNLESLDEAELASKSLVRFRDGYSPDDIWAVRSLGIDPATGREVFLQENGEPSFIHNFDDETVVGNVTPKMEGVLSSNLNYKGFLLGINVRYRLGGQTFNHALYNKIENINRSQIAYNQDARALYDRWQQPGDNAKFKGITNTSNTPISSRFVQKNNVLIGESINVGYRAANKEWLNYLGVSSLRINAYMNDIFRISTVKAERGIDYPFTRSVSLSINATF